MTFFKRQTMGQNLLMGRVTAESIKRDWLASAELLPGRKVWVVSRDLGTVPVGSCNGTDLYVAGGASVYRQTLPLCDELMLTRTFDSPLAKADSYFPIGLTSTYSLSASGKMRQSDGLRWRTEILTNLLKRR